MKTLINFSEIAEKFGTPTYVYDKLKIEQNFRKLYDSFSKYFKNFSIHYSVKANSNPHILKIFKSLGSKADVSSPIELKLALLSGFQPNEIMYTGNYESNDDFAEISKYQIRINFDDIDSFKRFLNFTKPDIVSFRVITTGGTDAKFGVPYELIPEAYCFAKSLGFEQFGVHIMTGSNILEPFYFAEILEKLFKIIGKTFQKLKIKLVYIDIGGGFGIPYTDDEKELDISYTCQLISEVFYENLAKYELGEPELIIEPGRYLIANAGYLVSKITNIKNGYKKFVGIDAGMNTLIRPALYGAKHKIFVYGKSEPTQIVNVCGQICENSDILAFNVPFPNVKIGDIVVVCDAGAYGFSMSSNYNGRPRPAEILANNGQFTLIRRRETIEDILATIVASEKQ